MTTLHFFLLHPTSAGFMQASKDISWIDNTQETWRQAGIPRTYEKDVADIDTREEIDEAETERRDFGPKRCPHTP